MIPKYIKVINASFIRRHNLKVTVFKVIRESEGKLFYSVEGFEHYIGKMFCIPFNPTRLSKL